MCSTPHRVLEGAGWRWCTLMCGLKGFTCLCGLVLTASLSSGSFGDAILSAALAAGMLQLIWLMQALQDHGLTADCSDHTAQRLSGQAPLEHRRLQLHAVMQRYMPHAQYAQSRRGPKARA